MSAGRDRTLMIAGACAAIGCLIPVALFQIGVLEKLPDPPGGAFASEAIVSSPQARPLGVPDALLGLASYGLTLTLAVAARDQGLTRRLLGLKIAGDVALASVNAGRQVVVFRKLCSWCTGTALATAVMAYGGRRIVRAAWK